MWIATQGNKEEAFLNVAEEQFGITRHFCAIPKLFKPTPQAVSLKEPEAPQYRSQLVLVHAVDQFGVHSARVGVVVKI